MSKQYVSKMGGSGDSEHGFPHLQQPSPLPLKDRSSR